MGDRMRGSFDLDGGMAAVIDQQRAAILEGVRKADYVSVSFYDSDGGTHWAIAIPSSEAEMDSDQFLLYALAKAWRDFQGETGLTDLGVAAAVRLALEKIDQHEEES